tara:strand:+ start:1660 stop:2676 length:1017 start_codon:yes stop_codon:yes gene_type:complete
MATYTSKVVHTPGLGLDPNNFVFAFVYRLEDGSVYQPSDVNAPQNGGVWPGPVTLHTVEAGARNIYRAYYTELRSTYGSYTLTLDLEEWADGNYIIETRELYKDPADLQNIQVESPPIETLEIVVIDEEVQEGDLSVTIESSPALDLVAYIKRDRDGRYYKSIELGIEFSEIDLQTAPSQERLPFRNSFDLEQGSNTSYRLDKVLTGFEDGSYTLTVYSVSSDGNIDFRAGVPYNFHVLDGRLERGVLFGTVGISHDTGSPGNLRYIGDNGAPISGATVYVIPTEDYTPGVYANSVGTTLTDIEGNWVNSIPAQAGTPYTVVFHLPGRYGPDAVNISV